MKRVTVTLVTFLTICVAGASASIIVVTGNNPSPTEQNILLNVASGPAATITGSTNQTNTLVNFTTTGGTLVADSQGQSMITATAGSFNNITIGVSSGTIFTDLIFALNLAGAGTSCASCVTFSANANESNGTIATVTGGSFGAGPGTTFFTATASGGETLNSFTITSTSPLEDIRQVRISGVSSPGGGTGGVPVPEPSTYLLMAAGVGLIAIGRKKIRA